MCTQCSTGTQEEANMTAVVMETEDRQPSPLWEDDEGFETAPPRRSGMAPLPRRGLDLGAGQHRGRDLGARVPSADRARHRRCARARPQPARGRPPRAPRPGGSHAVLPREPLRGPGRLRGAVRPAGDRRGARRLRRRLPEGVPRPDPDLRRGGLVGDRPAHPQAPAASRGAGHRRQRERGRRSRGPVVDVGRAGDRGRGHRVVAVPDAGAAVAALLRRCHPG